MKLFKSANAVLEEINKLRHAENYRREDRATVSEFFNGAPPLTDAEAEALGFTINVNHLFGYNELTEAKDQMFSLFTKPARLCEVELDAAPPGKRIDMGMAAQEEASRVLRKIHTFKNAYEGVCGDGGLHGEAMFFYPNTTFPLPKQCPLSKMLVPDDSPADASALTHFCIEGELTLPELHWYWKRAPKHWRTENLGKIIDSIYKDCLTDGRTLDPTNVEEAEYRRQENSSSNQRRRPGVDVYYFYQQRCDKPGNPFDLTILRRQEVMMDSDKKDDAILYQCEELYPTINDCLHPFFADCIIGGAPKWHRVLGLGTLNYQINHAVELLVNRAQQATVEGSMNLWQAKDTATREAAQQILLKHNGIIPEGMELIQNRFAPNFAGILEMIQFFRQQGSQNARGVTPNDGTKNDQLEVQAMFQQNLAASSSNARASNWYDYLDRMWSKSFERLANPFITKDEPGYSVVMDFQNAMHRLGIPLWWLQPANVRVRAVRLVGDGLRSKELQAAQYLTQNRSSYAPEVQPKITRMVTALALDNYRLAEELTPIQEEPDSPQKMRAENENAIMLTQRKPLAPNADDIDELHVMGHFPAMEILISDALQFQNAAFTPPQAQSFQAIGGHIVAHIERIEGRAQNSRNDPEREKSRRFMEQLNQYASMGEKFVNNMEQAQGGQEQKIDPVEMARLQLDAEKLSVQREKLNHSVAKFERTQSSREHALAFDQMLKLEGDRRATIKDRRDGALRDTEVAVKVATANKPTPQ